MKNSKAITDEERLRARRDKEELRRLTKDGDLNWPTVIQYIQEEFKYSTRNRLLRVKLPIGLAQLALDGKLVELSKALQPEFKERFQEAWVVQFLCNFAEAAAEIERQKARKVLKDLLIYGRKGAARTRQMSKAGFTGGKTKRLHVYVQHQKYIDEAQKIIDSRKTKSPSVKDLSNKVAAKFTGVRGAGPNNLEKIFAKAIKEGKLNRPGIFGGSFT